MRFILLRRLWSLLLLCVCFMGCTDDAIAPTKSGESFVDSGAFWAIDVADIGASTDTNRGADVGSSCYDACIKKGESKAVCSKACQAKNAATDAKCMAICAKKGLPKDECAVFCPVKSDKTDADCMAACAKKGLPKDKCAGFCPAK